MVIQSNKNYICFECKSNYGASNSKISDKFCAFILAITPILQHYIGIYENAGFTLLLLAMPILIYKFISNSKFPKKNLFAIIPLIIFEIYTAIDHFSGVSRIVYILFMIPLFLCVAKGCVNTTYFLKYATNIVCLAAYILIIQYISHYLFHFTLDFVPLNLLVDRNSIWIRHSATKYSIGKLYRPSAFFLEPSHLFLYAFPILCILLLSQNMTKQRMKKAVIVTLAMLLSTSGFSLCISIGLWILYFLFYKENNARNKSNIKKIFSGRTFLVSFAIIIVLILAFLFVPVFRRSILRIFTVSEGESSTAIDGRIRLATGYIKSISGKNILFGQANVTAGLDFNLAGFFATYIKWGLIGLILTYWFYGQGLIKLKESYFWLTVIIIVISFFTAHTHGTFYMLYYIIYLIEGYCHSAKNERNSICIVC